MAYTYRLLRVVPSAMDQSEVQINELAAQGFRVITSEQTNAGMIVVMEGVVEDLSGAASLEAVGAAADAEPVAEELPGEKADAAYPFGKNIRVANGKPAKTKVGRGKFKPVE